MPFALRPMLFRLQHRTAAFAPKGRPVCNLKDPHTCLISFPVHRACNLITSSSFFMNTNPNRMYNRVWAIGPYM